MRKNRGFTLAELMVVVVVMGILAAIAIPNWIRMQDQAKEGSIKNNMHVLQTAVEDFNIRGGYRYPQNFVEKLIDANPAYVGYEPNISITSPENPYGPPTGDPPSYGNNAILAGNLKNPFYPFNYAVHDAGDNNIGVVLYEYNSAHQSYTIRGRGRKGLFIDLILQNQ
jgi:prepilin-type N-terminal cleavage/methylation domain-containing protein